MRPAPARHFGRWTARLLAAGAIFALVMACAASPVMAKGKRPRCDGQRATIVGGKKAKVINGTQRRDVIVARGGANTISAKGGEDVICAGVGDDTVDGGPGADRIVAGEGNDSIVAGPGADITDGGGGNDHIDVRDGETDITYAGAGDDEIDTADGVADVTDCGDGTDLVKADEIIPDNGNLPDFFLEHEVGCENHPPAAVLTVNPSGGQLPLFVQFDGSQSYDREGLVKWKLDFGDESSVAGTGNPPVTNHTYLAAGTFTASLEVTDGGGLTATATRTITVTP